MTCFDLIRETRLQITLLPTNAGERERERVIVIVTFVITS